LILTKEGTEKGRGRAFELFDKLALRKTVPFFSQFFSFLASTFAAAIPTSNLLIFRPSFVHTYPAIFQRPGEMLPSSFLPLSLSHSCERITIECPRRAFVIKNLTVVVVVVVVVAAVIRLSISRGKNIERKKKRGGKKKNREKFVPGAREELGIARSRDAGGNVTRRRTNPGRG